MTIRRTGLASKGRSVIVACAVALSLAYPAPATTGQDATGESGCRFSDALATSPAYSDITYACRQGWFTGYPDGSFRPDSPVPAHQIVTVVGRAFPAGATRGDMAAFLRGGNPGDPAAPARFPDVPATHPQNEDIAYAVEQSWFQGYPDDTFRPDQVITATQITTVLQRAFPTASTRAQLATFMRNGQKTLSWTRKIAYEVLVYDSFGDQVARELWVAGADGSGARRLTDDVGFGWEWSPSGEWIAYEVRVRDFRGNAAGGELWVASVDGSAARKLTDDVGFGWEWSPDGELIAYSAGTERDYFGYTMGGELWAAEADSSGLIRLSEEGGWSWGWSPNGELIAYEVDSELWVAGVDSSGARRLVGNVGIKTLNGNNAMKTLTGDNYVTKRWRWSPDGKWIGYVLNRRGDSWVAEELWVVGVDVSGARRLTDGVAINNLWLSPDGRRVVYETRVRVANSIEYTNELWVAGANGSSVYRLTDNVAIQDWRWSPDGESIVYMVDARDFSDRRRELWAVGVDGSGMRRLTGDIAIEGWSLSSDGEKFAYGVTVQDSRGNETAKELWVAGVDGSGARRLVDDVGYWQWQPRGS